MIEKEEDVRLLRELKQRPEWQIYEKLIIKEAGKMVRNMLKSEATEYDRGFVNGLLFKIKSLTSFIEDIERELQEETAET